MDLKNIDEVTAIANTESESEFNADEATKEILQSAITHLQNPKAETLDYPEKPISGGDGGMTRFIMLKAHRGGPLGREYWISVAANSQRTLGFGLAQSLREERSTKEVTVTVFDQNPTDRLAGRGKIRRLQVSGDLENITATHFLTADQGRQDTERWHNGYNPLMRADVLFAHSRNMQKGTPDDMKLIQGLLKDAKFDRGMQQRVIGSEEKFNKASVVNVGLDALSQPKNQTALPKPK